MDPNPSYGYIASKEQLRNEFTCGLGTLRGKVVVR
jgi:hypothetical protein